MRIGLLGGVFGSPMGAYALSAPENVLLRYLTEAGETVVPLSISEPPRLSPLPDVWHANHFGVGAYHLAFSGASPFVFTSHNPFLVSDFPVPESRLERWLQRYTLNRADAIVALSAREADLLAARFDVPRDRFTVIPNGLALEHYEAPPSDTPDDRDAGVFEVLAIGQLVEYKGHRYLLDAIAKLAAELPGLRLTIVTHQAAQREEQLAYARTLGIADRLTYEGPYATDELAAVLRRCDVFVQPSLAECFPVTVLEAMASGAPVIATDVGGVAEEIGSAGIVVPARDAEALAVAIRRLAHDPAERAALASAGTGRVHELYNGRRVAELHRELYARIAAEPARRRHRVRADMAIAAYSNRHAVARLLPRRVRKVSPG